MMRQLLRTAARFALLTSVALVGIRGAPLLNLQPAISAVLPGSSVILMVNATGITDLYAFQFDLSFVPAVLAANAVEEGTFLGRGGTTLFVPGSIDNSAGRIHMTVNTLVGPVPGMSGDGLLAGVSFQALEAGTSPVTLSHVILLDSHLREIPGSSAGASITILPEPTSFALLLAGLAGIGTLGWLGKARMGFQEEVNTSTPQD